MFTWGLGQSDPWLVHGLVLMLVLMSTQFSLVKATTWTYAQAEEEKTCLFFLCLCLCLCFYAYVHPVFTCLHMCLCLCLCASENQTFKGLASIMTGKYCSVPFSWLVTPQKLLDKMFETHFYDNIEQLATYTLHRLTMLLSKKPQFININ